MTGTVRAPLVAVALRAEDYAVRRGLPAPPIRVGLRARRRRALADRLRLADPRRPLVITGLSGALDPHLHPGDVVLADTCSVTATPTNPPPGAHSVPAVPSAPPDPRPGARAADACPLTSVDPDRVDPHVDDVLLRELRATGLRVHVGPILTTNRMIDGPDRDRLGATGALAVDLESAHLLALAGPRRVVVVRVIADTPRYPLRHPAIVFAGLTGLRTLSRLGPPLCCWAAVAGTELPKEARS